MNADRGIPRGFAALHTPAGYARRYVAKNEMKIFQILLLVMSAILFCGCSPHIKRGYGNLKVGMTRKQVVRLVGEPHNVDSTGRRWLYYEAVGKTAFALTMDVSPNRPVKLLKISPWGGYRSGPPPKEPALPSPLVPIKGLD